jgi:hypothetical protein
MAQICAAGIPNASEFARRRVHLPGSKAAKGAGGARYRQPCVQLRAQFPGPGDGGPKPEPDGNSRRGYSVSVPLSVLPHLTVASRSGDRLGGAKYRPVRSVMLRRVQPDGRAGQGSRPDAGLCGDLAAARGGAGRRICAVGLWRMVIAARDAARMGSCRSRCRPVVAVGSDRIRHRDCLLFRRRS